MFVVVMVALGCWELQAGGYALRLSILLLSLCNSAIVDLALELLNALTLLPLFCSTRPGITSVAYGSARMYLFSSSGTSDNIDMFRYITHHYGDPTNSWP